MGPRNLSSLALLLGPLLGGAACGTFGLKGSETGQDSAVEGIADTLTVASVSPEWGPLNTETEVTVRGSGFRGAVTFAFGNTEVEPFVLSDTELIVTTPSVPVEAAVDITVTSDLGEVVLPNGFFFTDSAPPDDGGDSGTGDGGGSGSGGSSDGGSGGTDNSGTVTAYVEHNYFVVGCPTCLGYGGYESVESFAIFHAPTTGSWFDWFPRQGSCAVNPPRTHPTSSYTDVGSTALLQAGATSVDMSRTRDGAMTYYSKMSTNGTSYSRNTSYDLLAPYATPAIEAPSVLRTIPSGFTSIEPIALFNDSYDAFVPFDAGAARFSWSPAGTADGVVISFLIFDSTGSTYHGEVFCWVADSGYFQVPLTDLAAVAYSGDLAMVYYYKFTLGEGTNPSDQSTIESASAFGGLGTITLY